MAAQVPFMTYKQCMAAPCGKLTNQTQLWRVNLRFEPPKSQTRRVAISHDLHKSGLMSLPFDHRNLQHIEVIETNRAFQCMYTHFLKLPGV